MKMTYRRFTTLLAILALCIVPLTGRAAPGDVWVHQEDSNGGYNIVKLALSAGQTLTVDANNKVAAVTVPTSTLNYTTNDISVTTTSLTLQPSGVGILAGKYTQSVTFSTAFASGVVPEVFVQANGLATSAWPTSVTNTGFVLVCPLNVSANGTMQYFAAKKQ